MYNYYNSKEELLRDIFRDGIEKIAVFLKPGNKGNFTKDEFRILIEETFRMISGNRIFWSLYFSVIMQPAVMKMVGGEISNTYREMYSVLTGYFTSIGHDDPESEAMIFGSMLDGISFNYLLNPDFYPLEKVKNKLIKMYI